MENIQKISSIPVAELRARAAAADKELRNERLITIQDTAELTLPKQAIARDQQTSPLPLPTSETQDRNALAGIDSRERFLGSLAVGELSRADAQASVARDIADFTAIRNEGTRASAAVVIGGNADRHPSYSTSLRATDPGIAAEAQSAFERDKQIGLAKDLRKDLDTGRDEDVAAKNIARRYENLLRAGVEVRDLDEPAVRRLAAQDRADLATLRDAPTPHPRFQELKALVDKSLGDVTYRSAFETEQATAAPTLQSQRGQVAPTEQPSVTSRGGTVALANDPEGDKKVRAIPPLEDRFNVINTGFVGREYRFRDQGGKVAFSESLFSLKTPTDSPAAIKAMIDRAAERGWGTVNVNGSPEFRRQAWIAAEAQGIKAVGYTPTQDDRASATKERARIETTRGASDAREASAAAQADTARRTDDDRAKPTKTEQRQLAAAIEKALADNKVPVEVRNEVRQLLQAEGDKRLSRGQRFKVPVYDARAPRAQARTTTAPGQRPRDPERSR